MKKYDFTVPGSVCTVQILKFHRMPRIGESETVLNQKTAMDYYMGGCAYNIWIALAKLGASTYPVFKYRGDICNKQMRSDCATYGAPTDSLYMPNADAGYHCLMFQDDNRDHITVSIPFGKDIENIYDLERIEYDDRQFKNSKCAIFALNYDKEALDLAEKYGLTIAYSYRNDPVLGPKHMVERILYAAHVIFTNEVEAKYIEETYGLQKITDLFTRGNVKVIVTTLGKLGSRVYEKTGNAISETHIQTTHTPIGNVDAVGAGDGFVAGFMYGYINEKSIRTCAQYGSTVASFVIEKEGSSTNLPTINKMLERNSTRPDACDE